MKNFSVSSVVILAILVLCAALFWYAPPVQDTFYKVTADLEKLIGEHAFWGAASFVALSALSAAVAPLSSIPLVPTAIVLWGEWLAFLLLLLGWVLGGMVTYFIGAFAAYPAMKFFAKESKPIEYWRQKIRRKAAFPIVFLFRLALPAEIPGYVLGFIHYDFRKYILATALAEAPIAAIIIFASGALVAEDEAIFISWILAITLVLAASYDALHRRISQDEDSNEKSAN